MALSILNNLSAMTAENNLNSTQASLQKTLTELSSGSKINSGSDDAAGLSIANGLAANVAALTQSVQNATNGTGLLQTADGALSQVTSLLNRATTLATEASTSGITANQSTALNTEFQSILTEIDSIGSKTNFNGGSVFGTTAAGNTVNVFMSDGTSSGVSSSNVTLNQLTSANLGLGISASNVLGGTSNVAANDTFDIGGTTYKFVAAGDPTLTDGNGSAGQVTVAVGGSIQQSLQNLADAINGASGAGTEYETGATQNTQVTASDVTATGVTITASTSGLGGNAVVASAGGTNAGGLAWVTAGGTLAGGSGAALDLNNTTDAAAALTAITTAINNVAAQRGTIGAEVNRLTAATNVMNTQIQNLTSAESGITDADIGKTVADMSKYNTLEQTGISALQQANQASQAVLKLLQ
jgi:flagellin